MANPRQRRKQRSSTHKAVSHSKNAKRNLKKTPPIRGPKALQEAWDKRKTVKQNYARLGLVHDLNPIASGGSEKRVGNPSINADSDMATSNEIDAPVGESSKPLRKGFGRIIRNAEGEVIGVEMSEEDQQETASPEDATMEDLEAEVDASVHELWSKNLGGGNSNSAEKEVGLVEELQSIASKIRLNSTTLSIPKSTNGPVHRHTAPGEFSYLQGLVQKHGDDVDRMAKDRKLNPDQRTEGQLRRALRNAGLLKT